MGNDAFHGCGGITGTLLFPGTLEYISTDAFAGCSGIEEIILPRGVLFIGDGAFNNCSGVQRLWLTNSIQGIGVNAFNGMKNLKKVYFSGTISEWETGIQWADKGYQIGVAITTNEETASGSCGEALTWSLNSAGDLTVSGTGDMADFAATGAPWAEYRDQIKLVIVGQGVTSIGSSAFQDCKKLETVSLPGSLTALGKAAFLRCGELTNVKLPASLKSVGEDCFTDCEKLELLDLTGVPDEIMELRTSLEGTVTLPAGVKNARLRWALETAAGEIPCSEIAEVCGQEGGYYLKMKSSGKVLLTCRDAMTGAQGSKTVTFTEGLMILPQVSQVTIQYRGNPAPAEQDISAEDGDTLRFKASTLPAEAVSPVQWRSSDEKVAVVDGGLNASTQLIGEGNDLKLTGWDANPNVEEVQLSGNRVRIELKEPKNTTVNFYVQNDSWRRPVKLTHKITVTSKAPAIKLSTTTLRLNRVFPWMQAAASVTLNQGNLNVSGIRFESVPEKLRVRCEGTRILAQSKDGQTMPAKGKYTIAYYAQIETGSDDAYEIPGKLTVQVEEKIPTVKLSSSTVKLNKRLAGKETATVKVSVSDPEHYRLQYFASLPEGVTYDSSTGELAVTLTESTMNGGTFQLNGMKLWMDGLAPSAELDKPLTLKIQTYDKAPTFKLSAKGKLDVLNPDSEIVYTPKLTNCLGAPAAVELTGDNADLFHVSLDSKGKIHLTLAKSGENYSTKTTYKVTPVLTACGQKITGTALSVKVTQSAFKLAKLPNRTVFTTQSTNLTQKFTVASPAGAKMAGVTLNAKTTAALREAVRTAGGIRFDAQSGMITVPSGAFTNLKPGKYTLILDAKPENAASDAKPIQAQFTLTVRK